MLTLLPDLNLAALKYAYALKKHGGPISSVSYLEQEFLGSKFYQGYAELDEETGIRAKASFIGATKGDAINGAISEVLKSWAIQSAKMDPSLSSTLQLKKFPSARGFAAFPGLGVQGAMKRALFDAARCWTLATWLAGAHSHNSLSVDEKFEAIQIKGPIQGMAIVLAWSTQADVSYASAAGATPALALASAKLRLPLAAAKGSTTATTNSLRKKIEERIKIKGQPLAAPKLLVDSSLRGPWTEYAHVWRCLFDSTAIRENDISDDFVV
jgi:hypothetical protein